MALSACVSGLPGSTISLQCQQMGNSRLRMTDRLRITLAVVTGTLLSACGGSDPTVRLEERATQVTDQPALCSAAVADPDGDGWGWENDQSCQVQVLPVADAPELPIGMVYYIWHCVTKTPVYQNLYQRRGLPNGEEFNSTNVLTGKQSDWGDENRFHWWDRPEEGYYCLGNEPDIIRKHLSMLRDAGIDFLAIDITNHPNIKSLGAEDFILKSLRPLLDTAKALEGAPKVVPWIPLASENADTQNELTHFCSNAPNGPDCAELSMARNQSMLEHVTSLMISEYPDQLYVYDNKPLLLEAANDDLYPRALTDIIRPQVAEDWTVRRTWGLRQDTADWQFLSTCSDPVDFFKTQGWTEQGCNQPVNAGEQISVTAAYQYTYISEPFEADPNNQTRFIGGMPKFHGRTLAQQFRVAFDSRDIEPLVLVTGWNEWIASRFIVDGRDVFVDAFNNERNRDIEPGGRSGDYYYFLLRRLIAHYRAGDKFDFTDYFLTRESILDPVYYWNTYQDLQGIYQQTDVAGLTSHWLSSGAAEGRRPSVLFDAAYYGQNNEDLTASGITSAEALLQHFLDAGFLEGRQGSPDFLASSYLNRYTKVRTLFGEHGFYQAYRYFLQTGRFPPENHNPGP